MVGGESGATLGPGGGVGVSATPATHGACASCCAAVVVIRVYDDSHRSKFTGIEDEVCRACVSVTHSTVCHLPTHCAL